MNEDQTRKILQESELSRFADVACIFAPRNSITIKHSVAAEEEIEIGQSKIGGRPDLPPTINWPCWTSDDTDDQRFEKQWMDKRKEWEKYKLQLGERPVGEPLSFIAQIKLSDVAAHDIEQLLPQSGMLYFFYEGDRQYSGDPGGWRVIYYDGDLSSLRRTEYPESLPKRCNYPAYAVDFTHDPTYPYYESWIFGITDREAFNRVLTEVREGAEPSYPEYLHQMLGYPYGGQSDVLSMCAREVDRVYYSDYLKMAEAMCEWRLLLQVDSIRNYPDPEMMWGDVGVIYFMIRNDDLKKRDFSNIWLVLDCS